MANGILDNNEKEPELEGFRGLLGNLIVPGLGGTPTRKQLIDAAILRGSLELLKPKQPGQSTANVFANALTAAGEVAKQSSSSEEIDLMLKKIELEEKLTEREEAEVREEGKTDFPKIEYSRDQMDIDKNIASAFGLADSAKELYAAPLRKAGVELHEEGRKGKVGYGAMRPLLLRYAAGQVAGRPAVYYFQLSEQELPVQGEDNLTARQKFQELKRKFSDGISALKKEYAQAERPIRREKLMQEIKQAEYIKRRLSVVDYGFRLENDTETGVDSRATTELSDEVDTIYDISPEQFLGS
jgi:hypothetical protein